MYEREYDGNVFEIFHMDNIVKEKKRYPLVTGIELTCNCNFNCVHCYAKPSRVDESMPLDRIKEIIDALYDNGVIFVYLTGGEPLLRKDFKEIYMYLKEKGFLIEILTNATLLNEDYISVFDEYPPILFDISMYGNSPETYEKVTGDGENYFRFIKALDLLDEKGLQYSLKTIVMKENFHELKEMQDFAKSRRVEFKYTFNIFPDYDGGKDVMEHALPPKEMFEIEKQDAEKINMWKESYKRRSNPYKNSLSLGKQVPLYMCNFAVSMCVVTHDGFLKGCNKNNLYASDLSKVSFKEAWEKLGHIADHYASSNNKCANCDYYSMCDQCSAENETYTGNPEIPCGYKCDIVLERAKHFEKENLL